MTFDVELAGRRRSVAVEPMGDTRFRVTIDGQAHVVDAVRAGARALSIILDAEAGTSHEAHVVAGAAPGERLVWLDGCTAVVTVDGRRGSSSAEMGPGRAVGVQSVKAPMPGRIVRILVGVGDEVAPRQPVVVIEAMKMENELRSSKAGTVKDVLVTEGASVDAGRVLIVIE